MSRILENQYTRSQAYNREISFWMSKIIFSKIKSFNNKNKVQRSKSISFIELAEKIISTEKPEREKLIDIVTLEALRHTMKNTG